MASWFFSLATPGRQLFGAPATRVTLPTACGQLTLLPGHVPLLACVRPGRLVVEGADGARREFELGTGGLEVTRDGAAVSVGEASAR